MRNTKPYEAITDASRLGIRAVIPQKYVNGDLRVTTYESKALASKGEAIKPQFEEEGNTTNWPKGMEEAALEDASGRQELETLIYALENWSTDLEGADFTVYVDHNRLVYLLEKNILNRWQVRILDTLATYPGLKIVHIKREDNIEDGLSRIDHKIAQVAKMTPEVLDDRKPIDKANKLWKSGQKYRRMDMRSISHHSYQQLQ